MTRDEILSATKPQGGMFAVIPSVVMKDQNLSMSAKLLYGIITWKCNDYAFCWATNRTLGEDLGLSEKRVSSLISDLEETGHIEVEILRDEETNQVLQRRIYPIVKSGRKAFPPPPVSGDTPPLISEGTSPQTQGDPPPENAEEKYKIKKQNIPPKAPRGASVCKKRKTMPDWKPDRFQRFWEFYPRGENRQRAVQAWDKLQPDDGLIRTMGLALMAQMSSEDWQRGVGIPYASTWLNGRRWEDEVKPSIGAAIPEGKGAYRL